MQIEQNRQGAVTIIRPIGALVGPDADAFKAVLSEAMSKSLGRLVVDASAVPWADSRGLEVLVEASDELAHSGQMLKLCGAGETLREVLEITDLAAGFEHFHDATTAVRSFL
ncbi:MAG: STAS domain-containing protein [Phycisphaerales bacterium]